MEDPPRRRSTRIRKPISYSALEQSVSPPPEEEEEDVFMPRDSPELNPKPGRKRRKIEDEEEQPAVNFNIVKKDAGFMGSREGRLTSLAGSGLKARTTVHERLERWRDSATRVPEELLEFSIGWGVCQGEWGGEGGERQRWRVLAEVRDWMNGRPLVMSVGPRKSQETITLDILQTLPLCAFF